MDNALENLINSIEIVIIKCDKNSICSEIQYNSRLYEKIFDNDEQPLKLITLLVKDYIPNIEEFNENPTIDFVTKVISVKDLENVIMKKDSFKAKLEKIIKNYIKEKNNGKC